MAEPARQTEGKPKGAPGAEPAKGPPKAALGEPEDKPNSKYLIVGILLILLAIGWWVYLEMSKAPTPK